MWPCTSKVVLTDACSIMSLTVVAGSDLVVDGGFRLLYGSAHHLRNWGCSQLFSQPGGVVAH